MIVGILLVLVLVFSAALVLMFIKWYRDSRDLGPVETQVCCGRCREFVDVRTTKFDEKDKVYKCRKSCSPTISNVASIKRS